MKHKKYKKNYKKSNFKNYYYNDIYNNNYKYEKPIQYSNNNNFNSYPNYFQNSYIKNNNNDFYYYKDNEDDYVEYSSNKKYDNFTNNNFNKSSISKNKLNILLNKNLEEKIDFFYRFKELNITIINTKWDNDMLIIMMNMLSQIINVNSEPSNHIISSIILNSILFEEFYNYLKKFDIKNEIYLNFLFNFLNFLRKLYNKFQNFFFIISDKIDFLNDFILVLNDYINKNNIKNNKSLYSLLSDIISIYNENKEIKLDLLKEKIKKNKFNYNNQNNEDIIIDYKNTSIFITSDEIYCNLKRKIDKHIPKGPFKNAEHYINTLFYLEYEDCYRNLRDSISNIKSQKLNIHKIDKRK